VQYLTACLKVVTDLGTALDLAVVVHDHFDPQVVQLKLIGRQGQGRVFQLGPLEPTVILMC
jgi:hypothetical protein